MKIEVINCNNCPFFIEDVDFDAIGNEVCCSCGLLKNFNTPYKDYQMGCFEYENMQILKPLTNCPLKTEDINITLLK